MYIYIYVCMYIYIYSKPTGELYNFCGFLVGLFWASLSGPSCLLHLVLMKRLELFYSLVFGEQVSGWGMGLAELFWVYGRRREVLRPGPSGAEYRMPQNRTALTLKGPDQGSVVVKTVVWA